MQRTTDDAKGYGLAHVFYWILLGGLLGSGCPSVWAHHGGLGIEGDLVEWALKVDQWQAEVVNQGYRIKFLSYPRIPVLGERTRLVFEIQSVATGRYVGGLTPQLQVRAPDGTAHTVALPETAGVTAYYETAVRFEQAGAHQVIFQATAADHPMTGTFHKSVTRHMLIGDWTTWVGYLVVLLAGLMTWIGFLLAVQRRLMPSASGRPLPPEWTA